MTGKKINFNTPDDDEELMGNESGFFIESRFFGIEPGKSILGLNKCLGLLCPDNFLSYPILKKDYVISNIEKLNKIYEDNKDLFNFIISDNEDKIEKKYEKDKIEKKNKLDEKFSKQAIDKILKLDDYLDTLIELKDVGYSFRHYYYDKLYFISFDKIDDYF